MRINTEELIKENICEDAIYWIFFNKLHEIDIPSKANIIVKTRQELYWIDYYIYKFHNILNISSLKYESSGGYWEKSEYDNKGNKVKWESSDKSWEKNEYDSNGNKIKHEDSYGYWEKWEYDINNNLIKHEDHDGYWEKWKYNNKGNKIKYKNSNKCRKVWKYDKNNKLIDFITNKETIESTITIVD